jgi:hypothetical protein
MSRDHQDAIIDQMLREILGGDRPRDMTARVLAQAKIMDRFRRRKWVLSGLAVAASVALTIGVIGLWPRSYPAPHVEGVEVTSGAAFERGQELEVPTDAEADAFVKLGGYVDISATPQTVMTVGGTRFHEKLFLQRGNVHVRVAKNTGEFDVVVGPATVHVTGTDFNVRVTNEITETAVIKKMVVGVQEGSVEVRDLPAGVGAATAGGTPTKVVAGQRREFVIAAVPRPLPRVRAGAAAAMTQSGGREENRRALATRQAEGRDGRGGATNARPNSPQTNPAALSGARVIITAGDARRSGILRHIGNMYFLETTDGNFFMFQKAAVAAAHPEWMTLALRQPTIVVWSNGEVTTVGQAK